MRRVISSLGQQLQSVALRYRQPHCSRQSATRGWSRLPVRSHIWRLGPRRAAPEGLPSGAGPAFRSRELARVEAVLFLSREPVPSRKLAQLANLADGTQARSLVRQLRKQYDARGTAFQVEEIAGGFQLLTRRKFAPWLRRLEQVPGEMRLSQPAMETLAVVAYRQPVLRAEIEAIRGVQCGEILRQLMERDLVRIVGRADELGRPFLYGTSKRFLQLFGLKHLDEIPRAQQLRHDAIHEASIVANPSAAGNDIHSDSDKDNEQVTRDEEVAPVMTTEELTSMEELLTAAGATPQDAAAAQVMAYDDDEDLDEDYDYEDDEDEDYDDDEDEGYDEEDEEDDEEDEELEGDWEEVEDDEEEDDDEEYEEEYEDEDEDYEDDDEDEYEDDDEDYDDEDWDDED